VDVAISMLKLKLALPEKSELTRHAKADALESLRVGRILCLPMKQVSDSHANFTHQLYTIA
jgi:hypothetical protein